MDFSSIMGSNHDLKKLDLHIRAFADISSLKNDYNFNGSLLPKVE